MVDFFFKFIVFRVLENALVNQKIRSRHFFSYLLSRVRPKVFIITPQAVENYSFAQTAFFWKCFKGVWYYCQYVNICCLSFTFIIFIRSSFTIRRWVSTYLMGWQDHFENFWNYAFISTNYTLKIIFQVSQFLRQRRVSTAVIREFQKHKVSHVATFSLILPYYHFPNVYFH